MHLRFVVVALLAMLASTAAWAQGQQAPEAQGTPAAPQAQQAQESQDASAPPKPLWEVGLFGFGVTQTAYPGAAERVNRGFGLPFFIYRGKFFRADENTVGVRAVKTPTTEVDIGFSGSFGASSTDVEIRRGMPSLGTLFEFGPRLKVNLGQPVPRSRLRLELPLRAVFDVSDSFHGRGFAFEPELDFGMRVAGDINLGARAGLIFGDRKLNDYIYGVDPQFATATRPAYEGKAGLIATRLGLSASFALSKDWQLFSFARYDAVNGAANEDSPLVRKKGGPSAGIGLSWTFWRSERTEAD
jgi:MipA family protein